MIKTFIYIIHNYCLWSIPIFFSLAWLPRSRLANGYVNCEVVISRSSKFWFGVFLDTIEDVQNMGEIIYISILFADQVFKTHKTMH